MKKKNPQELFQGYRFWVAWEADEELSHLLHYIGEDHIVIGSDYGHNDPSKEPEFVKSLRAREDVPLAVVEKILCDNPRGLYGGTLLLARTVPSALNITFISSDGMLKTIGYSSQKAASS